MLHGSDKKTKNDKTILPTSFGWECYYGAYAVFAKPFIYIVPFLLLPEYGSPGTKEQMWEQWLSKVHSLIFSDINLIFATLGWSSTKAYKNGYIILEAENIL